MAKVVLESIKVRCPKCSTLSVQEVEDYHGPTGMHCPLCAARIPYNIKDLPAAWPNNINSRFD